MMEPKWPEDGSQFISYYEYTPGTDPIRVETRDVVHFRYQTFDPHNIRKGLSPIQSVVREIFTDDEAANYTASMLRNVGVPPVVIAPGADASPSEEELQQTKQRYQEVTTGDARGQALVMSGPTTVTTLGFNPLQMDVRNLRMCARGAHLGPAGHTRGRGRPGHGPRQHQGRRDDVRDARAGVRVEHHPDAAAHGRRAADPTAARVRRRARLKLDFDLGKVRVLQADENDLHDRARKDLLAGGIVLNEFRQMIGLDPLAGAEGDAFYVPSLVTPTPAAELLAAPAPAVTVTPLPAGPPDQPTKMRPRAPPPEGTPAVTGRAPEPVPGVRIAAVEAAPDGRRSVRTTSTRHDALWREAAPQGLTDLLDAEEAAPASRWVFHFWSATTGRYRGEGGRFVPDAEVREALDQVIQTQATRMRSLTQSLIDGDVSLADWQRQAMEAVKVGTSRVSRWRMVDGHNSAKMTSAGSGNASASSTATWAPSRSRWPVASRRLGPARWRARRCMPTRHGRHTARRSGVRRRHAACRKSAIA
jgi:hypothetical protein